jgi:hypothetical protein
MTSSPGKGWTIFQRRVSGSVDFYRNWTDYKYGFGSLDGEFWLGLDKIYRLSQSGQNVLRFDLENFEGEKRFAIFEAFEVANETNGYLLFVANYTGKKIKLFNSILTGMSKPSLVHAHVRGYEIVDRCVELRCSYR